LPKQSSITVDVHFSPWVRDVVFAAARLLHAVEEERALVTHEMQDAAADLRAVIERHEV